MFRFTREDIARARAAAGQDASVFVVDDRHHWTPGVEMLLEEPVTCPFYPPLVVLGVVDTVAGPAELIVGTPTATLYLGPDDATVARRASLVAAALRDGRPELTGELAEGVNAWLLLAWESLLDEVVDLLRPL